MIFKYRCLVVILLLLVESWIMIVTSKPLYSSTFKQCPQHIQPTKNDVDIDQLLGDWHLALVVIDDTGEEFEEKSICAKGRIIRLNSTNLLQAWSMKFEPIFELHDTVLDFPTRIESSGIWFVQSPLGGEVRGTIVESVSQSHLIIMYCGLLNGSYIHLMTLAMIRDDKVSAVERLLLLSLLTNNGYDAYNEKVISWSNC